LGIVLVHIKGTVSAFKKDKKRKEKTRQEKKRKKKKRKERKRNKRKEKKRKDKKEKKRKELKKRKEKKRKKVECVGYLVAKVAVVSWWWSTNLFLFYDKSGMCTRVSFLHKIYSLSYWCTYLWFQVLL
jgi:Flp pilus assembly protein TadB